MIGWRDDEVSRGPGLGQIHLNVDEMRVNTKYRGSSGSERPPYRGVARDSDYFHSTLNEYLLSDCCPPTPSRIRSRIEYSPGARSLVSCRLNVPVTYRRG